MKRRGRPATTPIKFMNGFYVEVRNKGSVSKGVIVRSISKEDMENTIKQYQKINKDVIILGEHKDFEWVDGKPASKRGKVKVAV